MATTEVADVLLTVDCVAEANVYGVKVPGETSPHPYMRFTNEIERMACEYDSVCPPQSGHEGRTGMAAVKLKQGLDFDGEATYQRVTNYLPSYARPRFIRIQVIKLWLRAEVAEV